MDELIAALRNDYRDLQNHIIVRDALVDEVERANSRVAAANERCRMSWDSLAKVILLRD